ncbi:hypothetical protein MUK42_33008, partial [Musa troglodytarum]
TNPRATACFPRRVSNLPFLRGTDRPFPPIRSCRQQLRRNSISAVASFLYTDLDRWLPHRKSINDGTPLPCHHCIALVCVVTRLLSHLLIVDRRCTQILWHPFFVDFVFELDDLFSIVAEASALAISLVMSCRSISISISHKPGKGDGHLVLHGHVTIDFGKRDKFLKEEVPLTGYLIVDYFPYRTTSVGLLVAEASTFAIIL